MILTSVSCTSYQLAWLVLYVECLAVVSHLIQEHPKKLEVVVDVYVLHLELNE